MDVGKAQIRHNLSPFYRMAGLTNGQIDELENRTAAFWLESVVMAPNSIHPSADQLPDDQLRSIIGDQELQKLQDFNRMKTAYFTAVQVSAVVGYTAPPLASEQADQLAQIVAGSSSSYQSGGKVEMGSVNWGAAMERAKTVLTPAQWQAAEGVFQSMSYQQALNQAQREANAVAKPKS